MDAKRASYSSINLYRSRNGYEKMQLMWKKNVGCIVLQKLSNKDSKSFCDTLSPYPTPLRGFTFYNLSKDTLYLMSSNFPLEYYSKSQLYQSRKGARNKKLAPNNILQLLCSLSNAINMTNLTKLALTPPPNTTNHLESYTVEPCPSLVACCTMNPHNASFLMSSNKEKR